ncbi:hypothetical protein [Hymenobacter sp. GOD-10R]|uniref:hypothetical protein n=1 Tax=Hymenobacter sp. GOD-10R TaxID=3093922 RepID=UPI002D7A3FD6|nr:hypothetical protein [Hymenobacter sp. GOD-10R]WRQ27695.1 hypothetical protein SD425_21730 [Hymenobacter sp. GOD-10R]
MNLTSPPPVSRNQSMATLLRLLSACRIALQNAWEPQITNRLHYSPYSTKLRQQLIRVTRLFWLTTGLLAVAMLVSWALQ